MNRSAALRGGVLALMVVIGFLAGAYVDQAYPEFVPYIGHRSASRIDLTQVQQAARLIQADYVDTNVDTEKLSQGSVAGVGSNSDVAINLTSSRFSGGSFSWQISCASAHRAVKTQPRSSSPRFGGKPGIVSSRP